MIRDNRNTMIITSDPNLPLGAACPACGDIPCTCLTADEDYEEEQEDPQSDR